MLVGEIERRKLIWRKVGDWMDTANSEDALPEFPDFGYSTSEKKLIAAILQATSEKRLALIKLEMRVIESFHPDYRWSDLIAYPDVQKSIKESVGFSEETWISGVLPLLLRLRPSSVAIRSLQSMEMIKKSSNGGFIKIGLETMKICRVSEQQPKIEGGKKGRYDDIKPEIRENYLKWKKIKKDDHHVYDWARKIQRDYLNANGAKRFTRLQTLTDWARVWDKEKDQQ
ncbi:hypothetical protein [Thiothrix subterranea]|uniref:Uncharacterized protein n=1 Tax=Thiothrix subterranea TaxID=2735563 RepID=A0AA51QYH2_9GAMM|nr:hypothetical protein [Thiothrix subterranea]MDQ5770663.1 hypothetical protein [Thiothrix subterranea]WML85972.1 hypothetical protein RCG00_16925 [Thiothrix subterranea]